MNSISLNMIVRNEAEMLPKALESVSGIVDEMIIVDTGSTDDSKKIAAAYGAKVYDFSWNDDFSAARNFALNHSSCDWILAMDADEYLPEESRKKLMLLKQQLNEKNKRYFFQRSYVKDELIEEFCPKTYIFPHSSHVRWIYRVHEQVESDEGELEKVETDIIAFNRRVKSEKPKRYYLNLLYKDLEDFPDDFSIFYHLGVEHYYLEEYKEAIVYLDKMIDCAPEDTAFLQHSSYYLISSLYLTGRMVESWVMLKNARDLFPQNVILIILEARLLMKQKEMEKAERLFEEVIDLSNRYNYDILRMNPNRAKIVANHFLDQMSGEAKRTE